MNFFSFSLCFTKKKTPPKKREESGGAATVGNMNRSPQRGSSASPAPPRPGGRVLGTPIPQRIMSPAAVSARSSQQNLASPSESSVSLASQQSFSFDTGQDGAFRAKLSREAPVEAERMTCPICNEDMVTLLQLNRCGCAFLLRELSWIIFLYVLC